MKLQYDKPARRAQLPCEARLPIRHAFGVVKSKKGTNMRDSAIFILRPDRYNKVE